MLSKSCDSVTDAPAANVPLTPCHIVGPHGRLTFTRLSTAVTLQLWLNGLLYHIKRCPLPPTISNQRLYIQEENCIHQFITANCSKDYQILSTHAHFLTSQTYCTWYLLRLSAATVQTRLSWPLDAWPSTSLKDSLQWRMHAVMWNAAHPPILQIQHMSFIPYLY